ncbi:MAG: ATP-binding protein [Candidatus Omnitrophica bacterium]|nr:ATP-binding protein [Candidatus Omnitrophota bacterium]MBU1128020.1 ATP-binding protein [Candidatus Omnitrophota bacterium]MBU1850877.1 ATP-binding protein [Candidatus Omnitrophota bacterium]
MIKRSLEHDLLRLAKSYPVVTLTGPRQSGKTTLVKKAFPNKPYVNLEDPDSRQISTTDPRRFLERYPEGAIIDEIQRVPDLLSYIQTFVDNSNKSGLFILTGSAQFELLNNVTQSLAGRTALLRLLPFASEEITSISKKSTLNEILFTGGYPRIFDKKLNPTEALSFYVNTYIERDVRQLLNVKNLSQFETFLRLCAARTGQILNLSSLGNDCGIKHNTAASWLSILEASYLIFRVKPHYNNFSKRLIKSPKIYFYDVGLAAYLLGIQESSQIETHPLRGHLFETYVISEILKKRFNAVKENNLFYFRDNVGNEIDIVLDYSDKVFPIEIKSGATFSEDMLKGLRYYSKLTDNFTNHPCLIYGGASSFSFKDFSVLSFKDIFDLKIK